MDTTPAPSTEPSVDRLVLDAAIDITATQGAEYVSMREVARRAGVSHQAPYHYFGDRAGIFAAIAEEGFRALAQAFSEITTDSPNIMRHTFTTYINFALQHLGHFRIMFRSDLCGVLTHPATMEAADATYLQHMRLVHLITSLDSSTPEAAAWSSLMWSTAHGFATLLTDGPLIAKLPDGLDVDTHIANTTQLVVEALSARANEYRNSLSIVR